MFCSKCGTQIAAGASFCPSCGNPSGTQVSNVYVPPAAEPAAQQFAQPNYAGNYAPPASGMAIAAIITVFFSSFIGLILGYVAKKEIDNSNGTKGGRGMANAAIALGWIFTILGVVIAVIWIAYLASMSSSYYY